jgi:hypothetical protein
MCLVQPDPGFADDNNYFKNLLAEHAHLDIHGELPAQEVVRADGVNATHIVAEAVDFLQKNTF